MSSWDDRRRGNELARYVGTYANGQAALAVIKAAMIRDFVRSEIVPTVVGRLYDIGMGNATFEQIVYDNGPQVLEVEAPAAVQVAALKELVAIGIPRQLGVVDGSDQEIPGVFVLGEARLEEAREIAGQGDFMGGPATDRGLDERMQQRIEAGEFEVVEVDETDSSNDATAERDVVAELPAPAPRLEDEVLARLRKRRRPS